jgi:hypothetical protein
MTTINSNQVINEIGDSANSINLEYAEISKYFSLEEYNLSYIKFFYLRNNYLISIQYVYTLKSDSDKIFISNEHNYFGPNPFSIEDKSINVDLIDEVILNLDDNEFIYQIKGFYDNKKLLITKLVVITNIGNYIELGINQETNSDFNFNFKWNFYFNNQLFGGFIIGWNKKNINYLATIIIDKKDMNNNISDKNFNNNEDSNNNNYNEEKNELTDVTYNQSLIKDSLVNPIYQTKLFGKFNDNQTIFKDYYINSTDNLLNKIRDKKTYLNNIEIYYNKEKINRIILKYKSLIKEKDFNYNIDYKSKNYKENENTSININLIENEFISEIDLKYSDNIDGITLKSNMGKSIKCSIKSGKEKSFKFEEKENNKKFCLIGLVAGYFERIQCIQFYYMMINK